VKRLCLVPVPQNWRNLCLRLENVRYVPLRVEQKEAIRNIFLLKKHTVIILPTSFGKSLIFQLLPFVFDSWLGATESFILTKINDPGI